MGFGVDGEELDARFGKWVVTADQYIRDRNGTRYLNRSEVFQVESCERQKWDESIGISKTAFEFDKMFCSPGLNQTL